MNTSQIKNFAVQSRQILMAGVLNRMVALGFDVDGNLTIDRPVKIQGGTVFMGQLREEGFHDAWTALEGRIAAHGVKAVCEEAAYTWFNRLVAIRIMQKNGFIELVMQYVSEESRIPMIVDEARSGRLSLQMSAADSAKLDELLRDSTKTNEQFNLLISAFCEADPVIYNCFGGIEKHIKLLLPDNILANGGFIDLLNNTTYLTDEDYKQSELIGWLYQYYISEKKDEVFESFKKGKKAEAEDIPAATQIFTPNWIVKYMVQNTLGRTYLDNNPYSSLGEDMKYLVKTDEPTPEEAILHLDDLQDYKMIDPACGSGHILVEAFDLLYSMYQEEAYPTRKAIEQIFTRNIIGIDLDTRAKQLATFALLMKACMKDRSFLDCKVMPRVLDMPEPFKFPGLLKEFFAHFGISGESIVNECVEAFELLKQADNLGSIMKFNLSPATRVALERRAAEWEASEFVPQLIKDAMSSIKLILALTDKYTAVCANPPYMGDKNMNAALFKYLSENYSIGKNDLCTSFIIAFRQLSCTNGLYSFIVPPSWMFLNAYEKIRLSIIEGQVIISMIYLSRGVFGADFGSSSAVIRNTYYASCSGSYYKIVDRVFQEFEQDHLRQLLELALLDKHARFDFKSYEKTIGIIPNANKGSKLVYHNIVQDNFKAIPLSPFSFWLPTSVIETMKGEPISSQAVSHSGLSTGDNKKFFRLWYELPFSNIAWGLKSNSEYLLAGKKYVPCTQGGGYRKWYGNNDAVIDWSNPSSMHRPGLAYMYVYFRSGISWNAITSGSFSCRKYDEGALFEHASCSLFSDNEKLEDYILAFLNSKPFSYILNSINPTINSGPEVVSSIPLVINKSDDICSMTICNETISRKDWDAHETSWNFKTNELVRILKEIGSNRLSDILASYVTQWEMKFEQLHENEEELNRLFIDIYGLQDELTPDVPLDEITILQAGEITHIKDESEYGGGHYVWNYDNIMKQFLSYAIGCWMGRYRLDREGLNIAYYPSPEEVCSYDVNGYAFDIDDDAIIPLMGRDTPFEDDNALQKIVNFVKMTFGEDHLSENLNFIEHCLGRSIEDYLVRDFWKDHKKMYQNRPIYWLFSSKKGAFQVLTYMHRMNPYTVEKIRTKYLLPYIEHLKGKIEIDEARGSDLTTVERKNLAKMRAALDECIEYHDRLHDVALKAIDFDLDDGVVVNYAKFGDVLAKIK